jgi:hypothetical protein
MRRGMTRVHPLRGGLEGWMALDFPVEAVQSPGIAEELSKPAVEAS